MKEKRADRAPFVRCTPLFFPLSYPLSLTLSAEWEDLGEEIMKTQTRALPPDFNAMVAGMGAVSQASNSIGANFARRRNLPA